MNVRDKVGEHLESYFNHFTRVSNSGIQLNVFFIISLKTHFLLKFTRPSVEGFLEIYIVASHLYN